MLGLSIQVEVLPSGHTRGDALTVWTHWVKYPTPSAFWEGIGHQDSEQPHPYGLGQKSPSLLKTRQSIVLPF